MPDNGLPTTLCAEWRTFLADESQRPVGKDSCDELFSHSLLFPLQRQRELEAMMRLARERDPVTLLITGGDKGGDLWSFIKSLPSLRRVVTIEIRGVPYIDLFKDAFPHLDIIGIAASSYARQTVDRVRVFLGSDEIDVAFLDGDKGAYDRDFYAYLPMMKRPGGIVFMHDCHPDTDPVNFPCGVVFRKLQKLYQTELILDTSEHDEVLNHEPVPGEHYENSYRGWLRYWAKIPTCGVGVIHL